MAKELVPEQELCEGRYVVVRVQSFSEEGGLYSVRRVEDKTRWALKEIIPPRDLSDEALWERREALREAIELLTRFEHPNLSRVVEHFAEGRRQYVVMEWVDGITLEKLLEMSVKPQPEDLVMQWGIDLCSAMNYMHDRPQPFMFHVVEPSHIMFNPDDNKLKLINYGLDRFILGDDDTGSAHATQTAREIADFARVLVLLLTKKEPGPVGLGQADPVSAKLAQVINRALSGDPRRGFSNFEDVRVALDRVLHPPVQQVVEKRVYFFSRWIRWDLHFSRLWEQFLWNFFRQPLWLVAVELVALLLFSGALWRFTHPPLLPRQGRAIYVACGSSIYCVQAAEKKVLTRIPLPFAVGHLATNLNQQRLYASVPEGNQLLVLDTRTNRLVGFTSVDTGPDDLVVDPTGAMMAVLHPKTGSLALVLLDPSAHEMQAEDRMVRTTDRVVGVVPVGAECLGAAFFDPDAPPPPPKDKPAPSPAASPREIKVFSSSQQQNDLSEWIIDSVQLDQVRAGANMPVTMQNKGKLTVEGAGRMLLTEKGPRLLVAQRGRDWVLPVDPGSFKPGQPATRLEGSKPLQLLLSPKGDELWVLLGSGQLTLLSYPKLEHRHTIKLDGNPSSMCFTGSGDSLELWVALESTGELLVVSPSGRRVDKRISVGARPTSVCPVQ